MNCLQKVKYMFKISLYYFKVNNLPRMGQNMDNPDLSGAARGWKSTHPTTRPRKGSNRAEDVQPRPGLIGRS